MLDVKFEGTKGFNTEFYLRQLMRQIEFRGNNIAIK
jgi:hypothetical protein